MLFLTRLFRRLRGLGTCPACGGPTIDEQCPACLRFLLPIAWENTEETMRMRADNSALRSDNKGLRADNGALRCENRMLSRRLRIHEIKAARSKRQ